MKTIKQLAARTKQLSDTSAKFAMDCHNHMVDIVEFIKATGNVTPATDFINAMSGSTRKDAIKNWFTVHGGCSAKIDAEAGKITFSRNKKVTLEGIDIEGAKAESPWTLTKDAAFKSFDLIAAVNAILKRVDNLETPPEGAKAHNVPADKLAALKALVA